VRADPDGLGGAHGLCAGARVLRINGEAVRDELDFFFLSADSVLRIEFLDTKGRGRRALIPHSPQAPLGIAVEALRPRRCRNRCIFCFVDQNPKGLRRSLYVKDEDFRLSFTHGHYITTTGLRSADLSRIVRQRLSPLYISVHATRHDLRCRMLGLAPEEVIDLLDTLRLFAGHRIGFHTQIVLCPGWNDGAELDRTLDDLEQFVPWLLSVAVVPVGLTAHRAGLAPLQSVTPARARKVIQQIAPRQEQLLRRLGKRLVLLADEFYLLAGKPIPPYTREEMETQIENGVGMVSAFWRKWDRVAPKLPKRLQMPLRAVLLTGLLGPRVLGPLVERLNEIAGLGVEVVALENSLYGPSVTVSGLLPGADFDQGLRMAAGCDVALLPVNALRAEGDRFLDDVTLEELRRRHPELRIKVVEGGAREIAASLLGRRPVGRRDAPAHTRRLASEHHCPKPE